MSNRLKSRPEYLQTQGKNKKYIKYKSLGADNMTMWN